MGDYDGIITIQKAKFKRYLYKLTYPNNVDKCCCCGVLYSLIQYPKGCPLDHKTSSHIWTSKVDTTRLDKLLKELPND